MNLLTNQSSVLIWQDAVKHAEDRCAITLNEDLEMYLIALLIRYSSRPDMAQRVFATAFLEAMQLREKQRYLSLQHVGDQCLLYAGLFPSAAEKNTSSLDISWILAVLLMLLFQQQLTIFIGH